MTAQVLTNVTPNRDHYVHVVVPDDGVYERLKIKQSDPYSITPYRRAELSNLRY